MTAAIQRVRVRVEGVVQGVGFRPYVHRLAVELGLNGFVRNDARGAVIEVEGPAEAIDTLLARLPAEAPPAAVIEAVEREAVPPRGEQGFGIVESARAGTPDAQVSPDIATCEACLRELFDPADRRHRYPFINCTDCGPRFTIVRGVPYDRPLTTMAGFTMCPACAAEYADPSNRRFHAQPNACPACGRRWGSRTRRDFEESAWSRCCGTAGSWPSRGSAGIHLACVAGDEEAVARLRSRKHREEKPFALMAPDLEAARELVELGPVETALLVGRDRPIVLSRRGAATRAWRRRWRRARPSSA